MAMKKLTLLLATFALLFLVASASFRTTIEIEEEENQRGEDCQQQCQRQQELRQCQMLIRQQSQRGGRGGGGGYVNQQQRECCRELQQLDSRCRCQCLEQAARRQQQQGEYGSQEVYETASEIPRMCNVEPRRGCDFRSPYVSF